MATRTLGWPAWRGGGGGAVCWRGVQGRTKGGMRGLGAQVGALTFEVPMVSTWRVKGRTIDLGLHGAGQVRALPLQVPRNADS